MSFEAYEYELVHSDDPSGEPVAEADLIHNDTAVTARAVTRTRSRWLRRFVFFETASGDDSRAVYPVYHGFHNRDDGSVTILDGGGQPHGWYGSLSSAWRRLRRDPGLWLAWLEPDPAMPAECSIAAEQETRHGTASTWYLTIPYTAHGLADARQRAVDIATRLESCVPGLDRLDVTFQSGDAPETETHVFCDADGCLRMPGHSGAHRPAVTASPEPVRP